MENQQRAGERQKTVQGEALFRGVGIHTGEEVVMRLLPAEVGEGIFFVRSDLPGAPALSAGVASILSTARSTILANNYFRIHTVEHVLAALYAAGITNCQVELSAAEPPIADGSAAPFLELIDAVGIVEQPAEAPLFALKEPLFYSEGDVHLVALPSDGYRISYTLHYPEVSALSTQYVSFLITERSFRHELAMCRTFSLYSELKPLIEKKLIRGGSLSNAVVVKESAIISKGGLRYPDELARHKVLDLIGDLSLVGVRLAMHVIAICSGHTANTAFARLLSEKAQGRSS